MKRRSNQKLRRIAMVAVFGAMAYVLMLLIHIPVSFLTLDLKDALITLCGLYFGPLSALALSLLVPLLEFATVSGTGVYGLIMNVLGTAAFSLPVSLIYKYQKNLSGAVLGLFASIFTMTGVMLLANLWITPYYMGVTTAAVVTMIPTLLLPFNLVKAVLNAGIVLLLYKQLSKALRHAGFLPRSAGEAAPAAEGLTELGKGVAIQRTGAKEDPARSLRQGRRTVWVTVAALVMIAVALVVIFAVLGGRFSFGVSGT